MNLNDEILETNSWVLDDKDRIDQLLRKLENVKSFGGRKKKQKDKVSSLKWITIDVIIGELK